MSSADGLSYRWLAAANAAQTMQFLGAAPTAGASPWHAPGMADPVDARGNIDYRQVIRLDAEDLAECGIAEAYRSLAPRLTEYGVQPRPVTETIDEYEGAYAVVWDGQRYPISGPDVTVHSWYPASHALFDIVNGQLSSYEVRLYALSGGHDLHGIFMTPGQAERARRALRDRRDWPYLPTADPNAFASFD